MQEHTDLIKGADAAAMLGTKPSRIKQLVRESVLPGFWADGSWWVVAPALVELDSELGRLSSEKLRVALPAPSVDEGEVAPQATHVPLWTLPGTITVLRDAGFDDRQVAQWLLRDSDELGERPIDALSRGRHHRVNNVASALAW